MNKLVLISLILIASQGVYSQTIKSYYTNIKKGEEWEDLSRTWEHADIVVETEEGKLIFWRGRSYLPKWETDEGSWAVTEVIHREGDGPQRRPDRNNSFSHVKIISSNEKQSVIHWRYLPRFKHGNPKQDVDHLAFVDEYFTISANGHVVRTIKQGSGKVDEWLSDSNLTTTEFDLSSEGIKNERIIERNRKSLSQQALTDFKSEISHNNTPSLHFAFNEGEGSKTRESVSDQKAAIEGHKPYWKKGVSGNALAFDGYFSKVSAPAENSDLDSFTLEAWVALGAYPFNWAPIVQKTEYGKAGFYFGVGPSGKLTLRLKTKKWKEYNSEIELPLMQWVHVSASFDGAKVKLYVDGEMIEEFKAKGELTPSDEPLVVGMNTHKQIPGNPVRPDCHECHTPAVFGLDGIIDELRIHNTTLSAEEIKQSVASYGITNEERQSPDLAKRELPLGPKTNTFSAHYTNLMYYDTWDNLSRFGDHADIVVEFEDLPTKFIFWRGMSYVPQVVNAEGQWYNNQFNESWDPGGSWGEPMSDKQSTRSHVRIIEDTPARKVIHWRYAQVQINGTQQNYDEKSGWGDWSDWYYYIYPDGVASKRMIHWSWDDPLSHEWQETIGVMSPGQTPESISDVFGETVYFDDMQETKSYNWTNLDKVDKIPAILETDWEERPLNIQVINYNSEFKPFTIGDFQGASCYGDADGEIVPYSQMVVYTHWPLGQLPTDGTRAYVPDRGSSNGYTHLSFAGSQRTGKHWAERTLLEGMSNKSAAELRPLAKSWLNAPEIISLEGASSARYDRPQRAYIIEGIDPKGNLSFEIAASNERPTNNLCLVIKNWKRDDLKAIAINTQSSTDFSQGTIYDTDGSTSLIVFIKIKSNERTKLSISTK